MKKLTEKLAVEFNNIKANFDIENKGIPPVIPIKRIKNMAQKYAVSPLEIEIAALQSKLIPARYERNYHTISLSEQIKLLSSTVAVIGCGGLGGNIIEMLARLGIGNMIVVDGDKFNESNLNRQLLSAENYIGKGKAETAMERIKHINSSINTKVYSQFIHSKNVQKIIQGSNLVVDALDNIPSRFILEEACRNLKITLIHGAINGFNGQVSTIFPGDKGIEMIYGPSKRYEKENKNTRITVPSFSPALVASFQVAETIKVLLNRGKTLRKKLLLIDIEVLEINVVEIE